MNKSLWVLLLGCAVFLTVPKAAAETNVLIAAGAEWKYLDDGSDQGTGWISPTFSDTGWGIGLAQLGYGDGDETTVVRRTREDSSVITTTYFRRAFNVSDPSQYTVLRLQVVRDDGVIVYLNGAEVYRDGLPAGNVDYLTFASQTIGGADESTFFGTTVDPNLLNSGNNVIAAEIHQANLSSSDISFDLELLASTDPVINIPPSVSVASPGDNAFYTAPADISITAAASDSDGTISRVEFFQGGGKLGEVTGSPFTWDWNGVGVGNYVLWVVATDNLGAMATSAVVHVTVDVSTAPRVASFSPAASTVAQLNEVTVTFNEPVQGVQSGDLLVNGVPAQSVEGSGTTYTFRFPQPAEGTIFVAWTGAPGIVDYENPPRPFDPFAAGASKQYTLNDTAAPVVVQTSPAPGATLRQLTQINLFFSEPVQGIHPADLLINSRPAAAVNGFGAGPYTFDVTNAVQGTISVVWAGGHGITDQASPPNAFAGGSWTYQVNTNALFEGQVVINEIMYHPSSQRIEEEYIELFNRGAGAVNLTGWRLDRGVDFTFPSVTIPAGGYLVVAADLGAFQASHPGVPNAVGNWSGRLSNSGEDLELEDASGDRVDLVAYADEGDFAVRRRSPLYPNDGWDWYTEADGFGKSLELRNAALSNNRGQNWLSSLNNGGTPGAANSVATNNIPPMVLEVGHFPAVPRSSDAITITAKIEDEQTNPVNVGLWWRNASTASPPPFNSTAMYDDGAHNDGAAADGIYGAILGAMGNGTVVEFYVEAQDTGGRARTWPGPAQGLGQVVNAMFQVDNEVYSGTQPVYRLIMTEQERLEFEALSRNSNAQKNLTFITTEGDEVTIRYNCGTRYRGAGSRGRNPPNHKVNVPTDRKWNGVSSLNLNSQYTHAQILGSRVALKSGLPVAHARPIQIRLNGVNRAGSGSPQFGSYAYVEPLNGEWAEHHFPEDSAGNVYSKRRPDSDLIYRDTYPGSFPSWAFFKESNQSENDWTDLINLTIAMDPATTPGNEYVQAVRQNLNVELWLRYFAVCSLMEYSETAMCTGAGDDYGLYRGMVDPRFMVLAHDFDTIFGQGDTGGNASESIWIATGLPTINRFLRHAEFEPKYYAEFRHQLATTFSTNQLFPLIDQVLGDWVPAQTVTAMKNFAVSRNAYVLGVLPAAPTVVEATITGEPDSPTYLTGATLTVGGEGVTHYRYRLNGGAYSSERTVATPIGLSGLADGTYTVFVIGRNQSGTWQAEAEATVSKTWAVLSGLRGVVLNEVLALNNSAVNHQGTFPDLIELYNAAGSSRILEGMRLTDDLDEPNKFVFPPGASLGAGNYLVVYANNPDGTSGWHLGFGLNQDGETLYLLEPAASGNRILDSVSFGLQLADRSIGRLATGQWGLCTPTFEAANSPVAMGDPLGLRINEWLANPAAPYFEDFIELYNPDPLPVALGGLHLTDQPVGFPLQHRIAPLSFVEGYGYRAFIADGNAGAGADHLNFQLSHEIGEIALFDAAGTRIDHVVYALQQAGISEGLTPNGGSRIIFYDLPTPGAGNPRPQEPLPPITVTLIPFDHSWKYEASGTDLGTSWRGIGYDDSGWNSGQTLIGFEQPQDLPNVVVPIRTTLTQQNGRVTTYYRTYFDVNPSLDLSALEITHVIDDGAAFYVNGTEVGRFNLSGGVIGAGDTASTVVNATFEGPISVPLNLIVPTGNLLAVELHQNNQNSADQLFGLRLDAIILTNSPASAGVVLNEVMANNRSGTNADGTITDWVELYNPSNAHVDLAGMSLTDDTLNARRWVFPTGSVAPARGYLVVRFDPDRPPTTNSSSTLNAGFGLKATGDAVYLFNRPVDGGELLDAIVFGIQAPDWSLGRVADGANNWVLTIPTQRALNLAAILGDPLRLRVNEWMANPVPGGPDWFEIYNPNAQPVAIGEFYLTDDETKSLDQQHRIAPHSYLAAGLLGFQEFKADNDPNQGADHVNFRLDGAGELIRLSDATGNMIIDKIVFGLQTEGVSEGRLPDGSQVSPWVRFPETATPGESNFLPIPQVVINEVLTHTDFPYEDAIELRNVSGGSVNISGWYLSDSRTYLEKFRIPDGTILPAGGYKVFYEYYGVDNQPVDPGFNPRPGDPDSFALSSARGDSVYLSQVAGGVLTGYRRVVSFGPAENGVSFGRYVTSAFDGSREEFVAMSSRTFGVDNPENLADFRLGTGAANSLPKVGPVVISEIMYHPPDIGGTNDNVLAEYVELRNITGTTVPLYDPNHPSNRWRLRDAVKFDFPPGTTLAAGGTLLVVSFDPSTNTAARAAFETAYGLVIPVPMVGPYSGKLNNSNDRVALYKPDPPQLALPPDDPDYGLVPYVLVEAVEYFDIAPWPTGADGLGLSLQRINLNAFANDAGNWSAAEPTPGPQGSPTDQDGDGMPDDWEIQHGLNPNNANDAGRDLDGDGSTNLEEYLAGTDPTDPDSVLRLTIRIATPASLEFLAAADRSYTIEYQDLLNPMGVWQVFTTVSPASVPRTIQIPVPPASQSRFYRLRTP